MNYRAFVGWWVTAVVCGLSALPLSAQELGQEGYADSSGVKIHYVTTGKGPLVVMLHGFPDYWYTWRDQIPVLAKHYRVVAMDGAGGREVPRDARWLARLGGATGARGDAAALASRVRGVGDAASPGA